MHARKRAKTESASAHAASLESAQDSDDGAVSSVIVQFQSTDGAVAGGQVEIPLKSSVEQLHQLINTLLSNAETLPYSFFLNDEEIVDTLAGVVKSQSTSTEGVISILYQPQAVFRVRAVTRCTSTLPGHSGAVLFVNFSPDGRQLASGSGDGTVRLWDVDTETPVQTLKGHKSWVLAVAWSPSGKAIASGCKNGEIRVWDPETGKCGKPLAGHTKWITSLAWEPMLTSLGRGCTRLASASKDGTVKIWDTEKRSWTLSMAGHTMAVECVKWGGQNLLYSASQDRSIRVWETNTGKLVRVLQGHAHWVNTLSLSTEFALRTGPYDHKGNCEGSTPEEMVAACAKKYAAALAVNGGKELLVSGSDDFTLYLWDPVNDKAPLQRMTGHQAPVNWVCYSPDGTRIASASFDKSVRLWNGSNGKFNAVFRGHVQAVYQACFSADSRLLVSSSQDSTMKVWDLKTKKLMKDLPGHADEVFACDWSPDGERVASGGKDKVLKVWRH